MPLTATTLSAGDIALRMAIALFLVLANGYFVAAEFSLVGARRTRLEGLAEAGNRRARTALSAVHDLDRYISGTQLGITLASLGLGWVAESTIAATIIQLFDGLEDPWSLLATHAVAGTIAFVFITFLHIVLGELAPKSLALLFPEEVSMWTAGPLILFSRILAPFIAVLNGAANLLLRSVGLRTPREAERVHRPEEIELLLAQTHEHGLLKDQPVEMIRGVFDLSETSVMEVMTPRTDIVALPVTASVTEAADRILESGHSRIPVYEGTIDHISGVVLARDVWRAHRDRRQSLARLIRPLPFVPETKTVEDMLKEMLAQRVHLAVVLDEYGGTAGLVTVEDLVEEIVGEIADEHEMDEPEIATTDEGEILVAGWVPVAELNERYGLEIPEDEYTTVAGFVMGLLGRIAEPGEEVAFEGGRLRVLQMSGRRIDRLSFVPAAEDGEGP